MADNYYALMSESIYHDNVELIKYYARQIRTFCKEHRCATCPFHTDMGCSFLRNSPYEWKGLEENENNDQNTV